MERRIRGPLLVIKLIKDTLQSPMLIQQQFLRFLEICPTKLSGSLKRLPKTKMEQSVANYLVGPATILEARDAKLYHDN